MPSVLRMCSGAGSLSSLICASNWMSPVSVAPRGLLVAALVLELPEDVYGSRAAELCAGWAPSAALSVGLVLVPLLNSNNTGQPLALPAAAGVWLCQQVSFCVKECVVPFRFGVGRAHLQVVFCGEASSCLFYS